MTLALEEIFFNTEEVVITSTRSNKTHSNVPIATEVISEKDINDSGALNILDLLSYKSGVSLQTSVDGGSMLNILGLDSRYILILIDGKSIKLDRFHRIAITAMKQTLKAKIPQINNIQNFKTFIQKCNDNNRFICHLEKGNKNDLFSFKNNIVKNKSSCILIGPEGDFTLDEIMISEKYKFYPITLGDSRLRTETAGIVACHLINIINNYI